MSAGMERALAAVETGVAMRAAQTAYFRTRKTSDLLLAKRLEKEFDFAAAALMQPPKEIDGALA